MVIDLNRCAAHRGFQTIPLTIDQRLPNFLEGPCQMSCGYAVEKHSGYFLLNLTTKAELKLICQRCLQPFIFDYSNDTKLALCESEQQAEQLMSEYDSIVHQTNRIDLLPLITDELFLYCPQNHPNPMACDQEISRYIG